jgi:hypothetical protein
VVLSPTLSSFASASRSRCLVGSRRYREGWKARSRGNKELCCPFTASATAWGVIGWLNRDMSTWSRSRTRRIHSKETDAQKYGRARPTSRGRGSGATSARFDFFTCGTVVYVTGAGAIPNMELHSNRSRYVLRSGYGAEEISPDEGHAESLDPVTCAGLVGYRG